MKYGEGIKVASLSLSFFPTRSSAGLELQELFVPIAEREYHFTVKVKNNVSHRGYFELACTYDDVVVFDATIEEDDQHNYPTAGGSPMVMDHILVVSRTYLPVNFNGLRNGGAPSYPNPFSRSDGTYSNADIIKWLREQIEDLLPSLPRLRREKGLIGRLWAMGKSLDQNLTKSRSQSKIFISCRSSGISRLQEDDHTIEEMKNEKISSDDIDLREASKVVTKLKSLKEDIENGGKYSDVQRKMVLFIPPGEVAYPNEILTEMRRWQVLNLIDTVIDTAEEVWVYETEGYLNSWWTQGELVTLAYRRAANLYAPKLRVFHPKTGMLSDPPEEYMPIMNHEQVARLRRWYSNCDPATMSPEVIEILRSRAQTPLMGRIKYYHDHAFSKVFWENSRLQCQCSSTIADKGQINIDAFLWIHEPELTPQQLSESIKQGVVVCNKCGTFHKLKEAPPRYVWMPTRGGKSTEPKGTCLIKLPTYRTISLLPHK
jgi:hypothetical protein